MSGRDDLDDLARGLIAAVQSNETFADDDGEHQMAAVKAILAPLIPEPEPTLAELAEHLLRKALNRTSWELERQIRAQEELSKPCPEGRWRWADTDTSGYRKLSEPELAAKREQAAARLAKFRRDREALDYLVTYLNEVLGDRWVE